MAYDIAGAFEEIELALIKSMRVNMQRHIDEEYDYKMNWTQWQAEMLAGLSQYRAENADVLKGYMGKINAELDRAIREAYTTGESEQEIALLKAIKAGYKPPKDGEGANMQGAFFKTNQRKLNALIKAATDDMGKAESAMLRMNDDIYRQTMFKAQMFYNTGAGSMWKCVDMATKDFLVAGFNCVEYKNGARVNIASYAEMSLRTSNKRANLMGQANFREKYGMHLVKINARGTACPMCLPYLGKVFVDDVYGAGTPEEASKTGYPLLSVAVKNGLFHPNCKDGCSTFYEGINQPPKELTKEQEEETLRRYGLEQEQRYLERNYRKNLRLANGSLVPEDAQKYKKKADAYANRLVALCNKNSDVLRYDKQRLSLRGVLKVDSNGKIKPTAPMPGVKHTDAYNKLIGYIDSINSKTNNSMVYKKVEKLKSKFSADAIIARIAGGDMTDGSCASLGLAYMGNKGGLDVLDFRGGESRHFFSQDSSLLELLNLKGVKGNVVKEKNGFKSARLTLEAMEDNKEYFFATGQHAAIVKRVDGKYQYLELQSRISNGWKDFENNTLKNRFGCRQSRSVSLGGKSTRLNCISYSIDIDSIKNNDEFKDILGYINTASDKQKKGASGHEK